MQDMMPGLYAAPNIHPLFIHFPVALWIVALLFWSLGVFRDKPRLLETGRWLFLLGTGGALLAVTTGFLAADAMGHDSPGHDFVHVHRNFMVAATVLAALVSAAAIFLRKRDSAAIRWGLLVALAATNAVSALGADRGVVLVYGPTQAHDSSATSSHGGDDHDKPNAPSGDHSH